MTALLLGRRFITSKVSLIVLVETSCRAESCPTLSCINGTSEERAATSWVCPHSAVRSATAIPRLLVSHSFFGTGSSSWKELSLSDAALEIINQGPWNQQDLGAVTAINTDPQGWGVSSHTAFGGFTCCSWHLTGTWFHWTLQLCPMKQYWWYNIINW